MDLSTNMAPDVKDSSQKDLVANLDQTYHYFNTQVLSDNDSISLSDVDISTIDEYQEVEVEDSINISNFNTTTSQNDLRELLVKVTSTENLSTVTQLKLKVITRELSLQQLSFYTPALRELILDGSCVSSLRDLGCGLKNLKILHLNKCNLHILDSVSGLENLEEIYLADNNLTDINTCAFLSKIRVIDGRRNLITSSRAFSFLSLCNDLKKLYLDGNGFSTQPNYFAEVKRLLPTLQFLDNINSERIERFEVEEMPLITSANEREGRSFVVNFPPRVLMMDSNNSTCSSDQELI